MHKFTILNFDEVESTNDLAFKLLQENQAQHHNIISANSQTKGRGRLDRVWSSPPGNLYFSLILQPEKPAAITDYSFLSACVIGDVLASYNISTKYKWPNDMMLNGKKLAGILLQFQKINNTDNLVIGVGLNLVSSPSYGASLVNYGISKEDFLQRFSTVFANYEEQYQQFGFTAIRQKWKSSAYKLGEQISLSNNMKGTFSDIDRAGNLLLLDEEGKIQKVVVAEILE